MDGWENKESGHVKPLRRGGDQLEVKNRLVVERRSQVRIVRNHNFFNIPLWDTLKGVDFQLKGGNRMKKLVSLVLVAMFALSMSACATMGKKEPVKVKCPACGYEFQAPMEGN